jgi:hypothetical protein
MAISIIRVNHTVIALYILERPSSWSTSRIGPSWPRSRARLSLLLVLLPEYIPYLLCPTQYLVVCSNGSSFTPMPSSLTGQLLTNVLVNKMAVLHDTYTDTHIYITSILLIILFFILLPLPLTGRLAQTLPVWHSKY